MPDKYRATWISHSSISDYLACPRAYYLKNVYRHPDTRKKMKIMSPALALGQAVHETLEGLSQVKREDRFKKPLPERLAEAWQSVSGKRGGFFDEATENKYRRRGQDMIARVYNNPGPIERLAVKIPDDLPHFWLSEEENIILCGKIDWLEYLEAEQSVHIIDFKTGRSREDAGSLQLPIYLLLVTKCQKWPVVKASYWYLEADTELTEKKLPPIAAAEQDILHLARKIKLARQLGAFSCPQGDDGCNVCGPYERILKGEGELIGEDNYGTMIFVLPPARSRQETTVADESVIL